MNILITLHSDVFLVKKGKMYVTKTKLIYDNKVSNYLGIFHNNIQLLLSTYLIYSFKLNI